MSLYNLNSFIGKRTAKGLVIRELEGGQTKNQWFVRIDNETIGEAKRMSLGSKPEFTPIPTQAELDTVLFFARRSFNS